MFKGGLEEAAKMLQLLGKEEGQKLLETIRAKDPFMADQLEKNMVKMEDLQYCSEAQLVGLLRDVNLEEFGLALRIVDKDVVEKLMGMVSTGIRLDIEDGLKGKPRKMSEVNKAQDKILEIIRKKVAEGHLVLDPEGDKLV